MAETPRAPVEEYGEHYFQNYNYADRPLGKFSMYWFARRYYAALVRRYAPKDSKTLLEIGSGLGDLLALLQDDFDCTGIDLVEYSVEQTKRTAPKAKAFVQDADDLTRFDKGQFDIVVSLHVVEHVTNPLKTIQQVNRVLKPRGLFFFTTPNPNYWMRRFKDPKTDAIGKDPTHINVRPAEQWIAWLKESGFRVHHYFGDGLWDVPYLPLIPKSIQFALFGLPAFLQVMTRTTLNPLSMGVNLVCIAYKTGDAAGA